MTAIEASRDRALSYDSDRPPERIEEDIVDTRHHLEATLDELERRLAPRQMIDAAKERLLSSLQGNSEQLFSALRQNAIPVFLIAAGLAWLLFAGKSTEKKVEGVGAVDGGAEAPMELTPAAPEAIVEPIAAAAREPPTPPLAPQHDIIGADMQGGIASPTLPEFDRAAAGDKPTLAPTTPIESDASTLEESR